jgi:hypothetical protein
MVRKLLEYLKLVNTIKVSQFPSVGDQEAGDLLTGLRTGANSNFNPGSDTGFSPLPYTVETALTVQMIANNGYVANNAGRINFTLPTSFNVGDVIELAAFGAGGWTISQNAAQQIIFGISSTTIGIGGSLSSTQVGDSIVLKGVVANTSFLVIGAPQGNITFV